MDKIPERKETLGNQTRCFDNSQAPLCNPVWVEEKGLDQNEYQKEERRRTRTNVPMEMEQRRTL